MRASLYGSGCSSPGATLKGIDTCQQALINTAQQLDRLREHVRSQIPNVEEPKAMALFETTAEVLLGLKKAYTGHKGGGEQAWQ
jgi:hypothetical protein